MNMTKAFKGKVVADIKEFSNWGSIPKTTSLTITFTDGTSIQVVARGRSSEPFLEITERIKFVK
jgi:hypothetical protein